MSSAQSWLYALFAASVGILMVGAGLGSGGLIAAGTVLLSFATSTLSAPFRFVPLLVAPLIFAASSTLTGMTLPLADLLGLLLAAAALLLFLHRDHTHRRERDMRRKVLGALKDGSRTLSEARDADAIIRAGVSTLDHLQVAPNIAFIAYRRGTPHILAARGAYEPLLDRPIHPGTGDSHGVEADHWVSGEALRLLRSTQRVQEHVVYVHGHSGIQLGVLILTRPENRPFDEQEINVIESFARLLGAQLGQWQAIRDLRDANELTLRSLGAALEQRDDDTGGHTLRVVALSVRLARLLGWTEEQVQALRWGAYLHDLGKLAIPDGILHKRGPLTPEERRVIQGHSVLGYDMLQDLHFLPAETLDLVRFHHERCDGTGYPSGLSGASIPATARLFSIVDVFDALTSARPYKAAWTRTRALAEIRAQSGRQFDPDMVAAFLALMVEEDEAVLVHA